MNSNPAWYSMLRSLLLGALMLATAAPALAQDSTTPVSSSPPTTGAALEPGDMIRLRIWREPDLSGEFPILENGNVVLPRLGAWPAAGKSPSEIREQLTLAFSENLRNPSIEVIVLRRINIFGEVRTPGLYPVDPTMTLTEAIGLAGGPSPTADRQTIYLIRDGREVEIELDQPYTVVDLDLQSGDQLYVPQRSWLVRNWPLVASGVSVAVALSALFSR